MGKILVAIDPGVSGAVASRAVDGTISVARMPITYDGVLTLLHSACDLVPDREKNARVLLENVGFYRPGNSGPAACTFSRHCGALEMALVALGVEYSKIVPHTWMKGVFGDEVPREKKERKEYIYRRVQQMFPNLHVLKYQADAIGMLRYLMQEERRKSC